MQIRSMKKVNFLNSCIHHGGFKYAPSYFCVYLENENANLKQETSEIVLFNFNIINLKSSENNER